MIYDYYLIYRLAFLTIFMGSIIQPKYSARKTGIMITASILVIWVANSLIYRFTDINFSNGVYPLSVSVPAFFCFFFVSKSNIFKVFFSFLTVCNFGMLTSFAGLMADYYFGSFALRILFEILSILLILFLILKFCRKPYFRILDTLNSGWEYLWIAPCILTAIIYLLLYYSTEIKSRPQDILVAALVFVFMFVFYAIFYYNFSNITKFYQLKQDREFMRLQTDIQKKQYNALVDKVNVAQIYRHDMRHHINAVTAYLNDSNIAEAQKYLGKLNVSLNETVVEKYCENYGVNVILSSYISKAKEEQIEATVEVHIPETIAIDNVELGAVFSNAIENAIMACAKIENPSDRKITIVCKEHYNQIYIQICNTFAGKVQFHGGYPVSNEEGHGFGTRSIAAIAEKHGGVFSFSAQDGIFKSTVILNYQ